MELLSKTFSPYLPQRGEEYMSLAQRTHFKKMLSALKAELSQDIDRTVHEMQVDATVFADPNDRASQESDISLELRNRDRERKLIKKIDETIVRIDKDDYGYCENCGIEIGLKRLERRWKSRGRSRAGSDRLLETAKGAEAPFLLLRSCTA